MSLHGMPGHGYAKSVMEIRSPHLKQFVASKMNYGMVARPRHTAHSAVN
jgi:hypothetical protein